MLLEINCVLVLITAFATGLGVAFSRRPTASNTKAPIAMTDAQRLGQLNQTAPRIVSPDLVYAYDTMLLWVIR